MTGWVKNVVSEGASRGLYPMPDMVEVSCRRFPSVWAAVATELAQIAGRTEGLKIEPSDQAHRRRTVLRRVCDRRAQLIKTAARAPSLRQRSMTSRILPPLTCGSPAIDERLRHEFVLRGYGLRLVVCRATRGAAVRVVAGRPCGCR